MEQKPHLSTPLAPPSLPSYSHESPPSLSDPAEVNLLRRLDTAWKAALTANEAFEQLLTRVKNNTLSPAALSQFANRCYTYWQQQLPSQATWMEASKTSQRQAEELKTIANGRLLYREVSPKDESKNQYYWSSPTTSPTDSKVGIFYLCHPSFELPPTPATPSIEVLVEAEPSLLQNLAKQEIAEQIQQQQQLIMTQIVQVSQALQQSASPLDQAVSDYCLAKLLLDKGYIESIPIRKEFEAHCAPFYTKRLLRSLIPGPWRRASTPPADDKECKAQPKPQDKKKQEPDALSSLRETLPELRQALDQAIIRRGRQAILQAQQSAYSAQLTQLDQEHQSSGRLDLTAYYRLSKRIFQLVEDYPETAPAKQHTLLEQLAEGQSTGLYDDRYRIALRQVLTGILRTFPLPFSRDDTTWTLETLTDAVTQQADTWHRHGKTTLANAQLAFYRRYLHETKRNLLHKQTHGTFQDEKARDQCQNKLTSLERSLTICERDYVSPPAALIPVNTPSQWKERQQLLQQWHLDSKALLHLPNALYHENSRSAKKLITSLCVESEAQLGSAPCPFVVLGLGSYGRGEISFASDIDFAILVADTVMVGSAWLAAFLDALAYKASLFPEGILPLESKELSAMKSGECWVGTPTQFIREHCFLPTSEQALGGLSDRAYPLRWPRPLYFSQATTQAQQLWADYSQQLTTFFATPDNQGRPYAYHTEPWCLQQHLKPDAALTLVAESAQPSEKKDKAIKTPNPPINLKSILYTFNHAILSWGRYTGYALPTTAQSMGSEVQAILRHLKSINFLPISFIEHVAGTLSDLNYWRLRQHWDWLHSEPPSKLEIDEVILWPEDKAMQTTLKQGARGFYLDAVESRNLRGLRVHAEEVILRSVTAYIQLPFQAASLRLSLQPKVAQAWDKATPIPMQGDFKLTVDSDLPFISLPKEEKKLAIIKEKEEKTKPSLKRVETAPLQPTAVIFNPLAAAFEITLVQFKTPRDFTKENQDVYWLASIMDYRLDELPTPESQASDPKQVRENSSLNHHWQVYWNLPQRCRGFYFDLLRNSTQPGIKDIMSFLSYTPNLAGWRLEPERKKIKWQAGFRNLMAADPQPSLPESAKADIQAGKAVWVNWVQGKELVWAPLKPKYLAQLFEETPEGEPKQWRPAEHKGGNHRAYCLKNNEVNHAWLKLYPEQPSTEYLVTELDYRLGCIGANLQQLVALHHAPVVFKGAPGSEATISQSAAIISAHVARSKENLHTTLQHNPQQLQQLDFISFALTLLRVLLTNPEDDKGNDYFLYPAGDSKKRVNYQLVRIDNERAFFPVTHITESKKEEVQVKSVIYCLDQMTQPWSKEPRIELLIENIRQVQPAALITAVLTDLNQLHPLWQQLFPKEVVKQHALCQDPWLSLPVAMIPEGLETTLLKRLTALQTALRLLHPKSITGLKLLAITHPRLATYYQKAFAALPPDPKKPHSQVLARFDAVAGAYYSKDSKIRDYRTSLLSGPMLLSRQLSLPFAESPKTEQDANDYVAFAESVYTQLQHSPLQALENSKKWQQFDAERVKTGLLALRPEAITQFSLLSGRNQQQVLEQLLDPKTLLQRPLSSAQLTFLLEALVNAQCHNLDFTHFKAVLTEERLRAILESTGQQILALDISGCTQLPSSIVHTIQRNCPHLKRLRMNDQTEWRQLTIGNFPELLELTCNQARQLKEITMGALPQLERLFLANANALLDLGNRGLGILRLEPWILPNLCYFNVTFGSALQHIYLEVEEPMALKWSISDCPQLKTLQLKIPESLSGYNISLAGKTVMEVGKWVKFAKLDFSKNKLPIDKFFALTGALKTRPPLTSLDLFDNKLGAKEAKTLAEALKTKPPLARLSLAYNDLGAEGAKAVAEALEVKPPLAYLNLASNNLKAEGAKAVAKALKVKPPLAILSLARNKLGAKGSDILIEALQVNTTITLLAIWGNNIPEAQQQKITELLRRNQVLAEQLWQAVATNQLQLVQQLQQQGVSINQWAHWEGAAFTDHTPLTVAVQAGHLSMVTHLLSSTFSNTLLIEVNGKTALEMALGLAQQKPEQASMYHNIIQQLVNAYQKHSLAIPLSAKTWLALPEHAEVKQTNLTHTALLPESKTTLPPASTISLQTSSAAFFSSSPTPTKGDSDIPKLSITPQDQKAPSTHLAVKPNPAQIIKRLSQALQETESDLTKNSVLAVMLVKMADVNSYQATRGFSFNAEGDVSVTLHFKDTADLEKFKTYYDEHFPGKIHINIPLAASSEVRAIVTLNAATLCDSIAAEWEKFLTDDVASYESPIVSFE